MFEPWPEMRIAILKFRLYDIDIVISRTLVYGALAAFITAVYVGIVVGIGTLIGAGGIDSGAAALGKIRAGADLVQFYSALVYRGLALVGEIKAALSGALDRGEANKLSDLVGADAAAMTAEAWPV